MDGMRIKMNIGIEDEQKKNKNKKKNKKERHTSTFAMRGCTKERPTFGEMHAKCEQLAGMPPVGSKIKLYEIQWCKYESHAEKHRKKENKEIKIAFEKRSYFVSPPNCATENGVDKVFEVVEYTQGIESPFLSNNHMVLSCVYPEQLKGEVTTIPARLVAVKNIQYVIVR